MEEALTTKEKETLISLVEWKIKSLTGQIGSPYLINSRYNYKDKTRPKKPESQSMAEREEYRTILSKIKTK